MARKPESRTETGRFKKGMSGNPGGRPKTARELKEAFEAACPKAIQTLVAICTNPDAKDADRLRAAQIITERVMGKPHQTIDQTNTEVQLTPDQRKDAFKRVLAAAKTEVPELFETKH